MNFTANQITLLAALVGAAGGLAVWLLDIIREKVTEFCDKRKVFKWLDANVGMGQQDLRFRSTKAIANHTNLTKERVEYICSIHPEIRENAGQNNGSWSVRRLDIQE